MSDDSYLKSALRAQIRGEAPEDAWSVCADALARIESLERQLAKAQQVLSAERITRVLDGLMIYG